MAIKKIKISRKKKELIIIETEYRYKHVKYGILKKYHTKTVNTTKKGRDLRDKFFGSF